jgi:tetratricopeptide (TPR) repeat protein
MNKLTRTILFSILLITLGGCQNALIKSSATASSTEELVELKQAAANAYHQKNYEAALPLYQELTQAISNDANLWFRTGNVLARLNRPAEAVTHYEQAVKNDPQLATAWHNMAVLQLRQAANTLVQMVRHINPDDPLYPRAVALSEATLTILGARRAPQETEDEK